MRLVADGKVDLDATVRRYVPEFTLKDERTAAAITVLNLLNHTAGLDWRLSAETDKAKSCRFDDQRTNIQRHKHQ